MTTTYRSDGRRDGRCSVLRAVLAAVLVTCLLSCRQNTAGSDVGKRWLEALNTHNPQRVVEMLDPQAEWADPVVATPLDPAALSKRLAIDWFNWKDRHYTTRTIETVGDSVIIEWHVEQTHRSGALVPLDGLTILQLADGKIRRVREYYDASVYLQFLRPH